MEENIINDVTLSETAASIFYQKYGVPIQGTNYDKKIIKTSRQPPSEMSKINSEDWPELTKASLKIIIPKKTVPKYVDFV